MNNRRFLNLVTKQWSTLVCSLRRINVATHLFYPSTAAAESGMARRDAAIKANARRRAAGDPHGLRSLRAMATTLGRLPAPRINLQHAGPTFGDRAALDFVALLGDESKVLCGDTCGRTCLYDADSHSVLTAPSLTRVERPAGGAIPITVRRRAAAGGDGGKRRSRAHEVYDSLYVMRRNPDLLYNGVEPLFQELNYNYGGVGRRSHCPPVRQWTLLPPPPFFHEFPDQDITAHAVVGSTIYVSLDTVPCTYSFNTVTEEWKFVGWWMLPFAGKAEHVPELNLWFGLAPYRPYHLCAADLSDLHQGRPPLLHAWLDLDMPHDWSPLHLDVVNLGSGRFCVVKIFDFDEDNEKIDRSDEIDCEFAVLTGVEVVPSSSPEDGGGLRMIKHKSRYHIFKKHTIECESIDGSIDLGSNSNYTAAVSNSY